MRPPLFVSPSGWISPSLRQSTVRAMAERVLRVSLKPALEGRRF